MDIGILLSIIAILVSFAGTIFSILYSKRNVDIMKEELSILKQETEKKNRFEKASKAVQHLIRTIQESTSSRWFSFPALYYLRDSIVRHLFDQRKKKLDLVIRPSYIKWRIENEGKIEEISLSGTDSFELFMNSFKRNFHEVVFHYKCTPEIMEDNIIDLSDSLISIKEIYEALSNACEYRDLIESFDRNVLNDVEEALSQILRKLYEELMKEDRITILAETKSDDIYTLLLNRIVAYETVKENLELMQRPLFMKLANVQRELFQRS